MNLVEKFLTFWAGADDSLLSSCPRHIRQKYISIGVLVLLTASFAFAAASYAFWTIFESLRIAVLLGALWGTFILNLDRFLLTTFPKSANYFRQILHAIPRLALAVMIGVTIAHPLMLRLFMPEIMEQIASDDAKRAKTAQEEKITEESKARSKHEQRKKQLIQWHQWDQRRIERDSAQAALQRCNTEADRAEAELKCEMDGGCGSRRQGAGPISKKKEALWRERKKACQDLSQASQAAENMLLRAETTLSQAVQDIEPQLDAQLNQIANDYKATLKRIERHREPSFLTRSEALGKLVQDREQVKTTHFGMMLLLILVEVVPVLMKVISPRDSLDDLWHATSNAFKERIPDLAQGLARPDQIPPPVQPAPASATIATNPVATNAAIQKRLRAAAIILITVIITAVMPWFKLSLDISVASAGLFVAVAPFFLTLMGEKNPHGSGL